MADFITDFIYDINTFSDISHDDYSKPVVVEFYSNKCKHCNKFKDVYESSAEKHSDLVDFHRINILAKDENHDYSAMEQAKKCGIKALPTVFAFKGDQITCDGEYKTKIGYSTEEEFDNWLNDVESEYITQKTRQDYVSRHHKHRHRNK
jgi:thioredoxin-like negative regulator of GroEL